jgi:DNA repair exonuclease SbcCD ATPase subunit
MKAFSLWANLLASALILFVASASAQQPAASRKRVPTLTTDDVYAQRSATASADAAENPASKTAGVPAANGKPVSPEESTWRENVRNARERAKAADRAAEEAELRVTALRNQLGQSGQGPRDRNETATELDAAGERVIELRAQARDAHEALDKLLEEGRAKGFTETPGPSASKDGKPNIDYYKTKFAELTEKLQTAERRVKLYDDRIREMNQRITINSRTGDNYYIAQLQQLRADAQHDQDQARAELESAQRDLEALKEEARRAGVPPGVFR